VQIRVLAHCGRRSVNAYDRPSWTNKFARKESCVRYAREHKNVKLGPVLPRMLSLLMDDSPFHSLAP
jgi:hypothetical protein